MQVVDLFCGAGGMALGLSRAGMKIRLSYDFDEKALAIHRVNVPSPFRLRAIGLQRRRGPREENLEDVLTLAPDIAEIAPDVIVGGPPCQPFSRAGKRLGDDDDRARLTEAFGVIVATARPRYFLMENVPGIQRYKVYRRLIMMVRRAGYGLTVTTLDASFYGTGQKRRRLIVAGCLGEADDFLAAHLDAARADRPTTVADVLGPDLAAHGIGPDGHFFLTPAGASSPGTRSVYSPIPTLTRTSGDGVYPAYLARKGDVAHVHELPNLSFEALSRLSGFPEWWKWDVERPATPGRQAEPAQRRWITLGDRIQMLANAVPPPLSEGIGRCILAHSRGELPDRDPAIPEEYVTWLKDSKRLKFEDQSQTLTDLRAARRHYLGWRTFENVQHALGFLDRVPGFVALGSSRKSNLRRAVRLFHEYEAALRAEEALEKKKSREATWAFDDQNIPDELDD